jgi:hypothetical protein
MSSIRELDALILANTSNQWRKVAMVIATVLIEGSDKLTEIDDISVAVRIKRLVEEGYMESQGDLNEMRYSEIRRI